MFNTELYIFCSYLKLNSSFDLKQKTKKRYSDIHIIIVPWTGVYFGSYFRFSPRLKRKMLLSFSHILVSFILRTLSFSLVAVAERVEQVG